MHDLYHPRIFELAGDISHVGRLPDAQGSATKVSKICGSTMTVDVALDGERIARFAIEPEACALGQASAAVLAAHVVGATLQEVRDARDALFAMLKEDGPPPEGRFWELRHLEGVRAYPQRHNAVMLGWDATLAAIADAKLKTTV